MNPFTRVANSLWDNGPIYSLSRAELVLLFHLLRMTTGYHRDCYIASESQILEETQLSRASLYRAKQRLIEDGLLDVTVTDGVCSYSLPNSIKPDSDDQEPKKSGRSRSKWGGLKIGTGSQNWDGGGLKNETVTVSKLGLYPSQNWDGHYIKDHLKENFKETSSSTVASGGDDDDVFLDKSFLENDDPEITSAATNGGPSRPDSGEKVSGRPRKPQDAPGGPDDPRSTRESSEAQSASRTDGIDSGVPGEESGASAGRRKPRESNSNLPPEFREMLDIGVSEHVARQFIRDYPLETLRAGLKSVLARVAAGEVRDPAAWFVREVKAGLYGPRKVDILAAQRSKAAEKRLTERQADEQRREAEDQQSRSRRSAVEQSWSAEERADLLRQARRQIGRSDAPEDFPLVRAVMFDLWQARQATYPRSSSCEV